MTDRDQVAREATLQLVNEFTDGTVEPILTLEQREHMIAYINREYPAPAAPVTVTVDGVEWTKHGEPGGSVWIASIGGPPNLSDAESFLDRIAADAQVIAAKDKRIAELEREVEELRDDARTADDARGNLLLQTICRLPDVLTTGDWQEWLDEHRHQWLNDDRAFGGWVAERLSAHMTRVERERDGFEQMAREYSDNADYYRRLVVQIGETCGRDAYVSDDGSVQQDVLCAKVPELVIAMKHERDEARRALEAAQSAGNAPSSHQTPMTAALGRLAATGASAVPPRCGNPTGATVAQECRDMATATSQGEGLGAPTPKSEATAAVADDEIVSGAPSPAPIPLGAPRKWWLNCYSDDDNAVHPSKEIADECADKTDPTFRRVVVVEAVADAATVERVAEALYLEMESQIAPLPQRHPTIQARYRENARAALRALGITIQEGEA